MERAAAVPTRWRWNHNIAYHPVVFRAVGTRCERVLDVGCGEGMLARRLRNVVPRVVGIDSDAPNIQLARRQDPGRLIEFVQGDFRTYPFAAGSFDAVVSVATLHHVDAVEGLARMATLVRRGGVVAVVGLARSRLPRDLPWEIAAVLAHRAHALAGPTWQHPSPVVWPPPHDYAQMREIAARVLPGSRFRRHALWRYSLVWVKP